MNKYNFTVITNNGQRVQYAAIEGTSIADARDNTRQAATDDGYEVIAISVGKPS